MLEYIRKHTAGIVVKAFLGLLIASFAVWGIGDTVRSLSTQSEVATIGNVDITPERFNGELRRQLNRMRSILKDSQLDMEQARALGFVDMILNNTIDNTLFSLGAKDLGTAASDGLVSGEIKNNPEFNGPLGGFDRFTFQQVIRNAGYSKNGFVERVREDIKRGQYLDSTVGGGIAPLTMAKAVYRHRHEKRLAETILFADDAMTVSEPVEADLIKFHKDNAASFTAPEYRALTFITLTAGELAKEIAVSEDEIKDAFEARQDEFNTEERRQLQQMVVADEITADSAHQMLTNGRDFAEVAKEVADMDAETLDIGTFTRGQILSELANAVFQIPNGGFSKPVESPLGWHVMRVTKIERGRKQTLDEVRQKVSTDLANEKAVDSLFEMANQLEDELGGGATLEEVSARMNLKLTVIESIDATGKDTAGKAAAGLPSGNNVLKVAFDTPENTESQLTESGAQGYFIVRVDKRVAPALRPLETVSAKVAEAWKSERRAEAADKAAEAALQRLNGGDDAATVAGELNLEIKTSEPFARSAQGGAGALPADLVSKLFKIKPGSFTSGRAPKGHYLARLKEIQDADPATDKNGLEKIRQELTNSMREDLMRQLSGALRRQYPVTVNSRAVEQLF